MKKAFTLVELMIVVSILGILGAIVLPMFQDHIQQAKEAAAKDTLRVMRNQIELYAVQHEGIAPGFIEGSSSQETIEWTYALAITNGKYISEMPVNPFNGLTSTLIVFNNDSFPAQATGNYGWIYKPATKDFKLDWPNTDSSGIRYIDY